MRRLRDWHEKRLHIQPAAERKPATTQNLLRSNLGYLAALLTRPTILSQVKSLACPFLQGKYELIAKHVDCCLGWLPSSFMPASFSPEEQCVAVLSLVQLLLVWALPIVLLSR